MKNLIRIRSKFIFILTGVIWLVYFVYAILIVVKRLPLPLDGSVIFLPSWMLAMFFEYEDSTGMMIYLMHIFLFVVLWVASYQLLVLIKRPEKRF